MSEEEKQNVRHKSHEDEAKPMKKRSHSPESPKEEDSDHSENESKETCSSEGSDKIPKVHSANSWEEVNLGDEQRKAKFLKLMGAAKKEHHGRFVIGDPAKAKPKRSTEEIKDLENNLKEQYEHCLTDHLKHKIKKHRGLGFDDDDQPTNSGIPIESKPDSVASLGHDEKI